MTIVHNTTNSTYSQYRFDVRTLFAIVISLLITGAALAGPPPAVRAGDLPAAVPNKPDPVLVPHPPGQKPLLRLTRDDVNHLHISGMLRFGALQSIENTGAATVSAVERRAVYASMRPRRLEVNATPTLPPIPVTSDSPADAEPAVTTITANSTDRTFNAWIHYPTNNSPNVYYAGTTNFSTFSAPQQMPPTGFSYTGDPAFDENPYNASVGPLRTYCVGLATDNSSQAWTAPNAVMLWHSDPSDNGQFTATPTTVDSRWVGAGTNYMTLDKPSVAVSWHSGIGATDLGYVYVAYTSLDFGDGGSNPGNTAIEVATSTDGGVTFGSPVVIAYGGAPKSGTEVAHSQIVVSSATGNVYVMWVDWSNGGSIQMAMSSPGGQSFGAHEIAATGNFSGESGANQVLVGSLGAGITAETVPVARYNHVAGSIDLVWHDHGTSGMDVRYAYRDGTGWHQVSGSIVGVTTGDQFMPAIDYNSGGNIVVTYYTVGTTSTAYRPYVAYCQPNGTRIDPSDHDLAGFDSGTSANGFIGDYQTVCDWTFAVGGEQATAAWIGYQSHYDPYLSRIQY